MLVFQGLNPGPLACTPSISFSLPTELPYWVVILCGIKLAERYSQTCYFYLHKWLRSNIFFLRFFDFFTYHSFALVFYCYGLHQIE